MRTIIFEAIGIIAGMCIAVPSIPQIITTLKTQKTEGLSASMFILLGTGNLCYFVYGRYLGSWSMMLFNSISVICSGIMLYLIFKGKEKKL